jgi:hypothetical protein
VKTKATRAKRTTKKAAAVDTGADS